MAVGRWKKAGYKGVVEMPTGVGKSYIAHIIIKQMQEKLPDAVTLVVVPTVKLKDQWEKNLLEDGIPNVEVMVINTAVREDRIFDLLVLDEIHRYASDIFGEIFNNVKYIYLLGLTATMERKDKKHKIIQKYAPVIDRMEMLEALKEGYVSDFRVYNFGIEMSFQDQARYKAIHDNFTKYFKFFNFEFDLAMSCLKSPKVRLSYAKQLGVDSNKVMIMAVQFNRAMQNRKSFLYNNESKVTATKEIVDKFKREHIITFSETIKFADELTKHLGNTSFSYHSRLSKKKKDEYLTKFSDPKDPLRVVNTARSLDEGFDMEDLSMAIICSGSSTRRQYIQRIGRTIRAQEGKTAIIVNLYLKGTQDENWLRGRGRMPNSVFISSIDEIASKDKKKEEHRISLASDPE